MKSTVSAVALVALVAGAAFARPPASVSTSALIDDESGVVRGPNSYSTGFEAPAFAVGVLEPQGGWSTSGVSLPWASVSSVFPAAGTQHQRQVRDTTFGPGAARLAFGPASGAVGFGASTTSFDFAISNTGGADTDVIGQAPSQAFLSWRINFSYLGPISVLDDGGFGLGFVNTGAVWTPGAYQNMRVEMDPALDTLRYFLNNVLIYTGVAGVFAGTSVEQFVTLNDNFQLTGETFDLDNVSIVPTPGAIALLGLGGLAAARRRRN